IFHLESETAAYRGQFVKARSLTGRAIALSERGDEKENAAGYAAEGALREALVGNSDSAVRQAHDALAISNGRDAEGVAAIAFGLAGESAQAKALAAALGKRFPTDTVVKAFFLPMIDAAVALH